MKGAEAETAALKFLESRGLRLLLRNFRAHGGELDLVMQHRDTLVIVEVRKRSHAGYGTALESVDARKRSRIRLASQWLLAKRADLAHLAMRFDVVALDAQDRIEWLQAAFDADD